MANGKHPLDDQVADVRERAAQFGWDGLDPKTKEPALTAYDRLLLAQDWLLYRLVKALTNGTKPGNGGVSAWVPTKTMLITIAGATGVGIGYGVVKALGIVVGLP